MAKRSSSSLLISPLSLLLPRGDTFLYLFAVLSIFSLLLQHLSPAAAQPHFEGFDADEEDDFALGEPKSDEFIPSLRSTPPPISLSTATPESDHGPTESDESQIESPPSDQNSKPASTSAFDYWDEDEFEGIPQSEVVTESAAAGSESDSVQNTEELVKDPTSDVKLPRKISSFTVEIACVSFLIVFTINYFTGKRENENLALAWATKFAMKDSIFDKNFSLLGVGETTHLYCCRKGRTCSSFSGRRFCSGLLATMELKSRHDLISRLYNMVVPCKDDITFEVYMNDDSMDHVVFALARTSFALLL